MSGFSIDFFYDKGIKKPNYARSPQYSNRRKLLNANIYEMDVLITPLHEKIAKPVLGASLITSILPAEMSFSNLAHASIIVRSTTNQTILIEYGGYDQRREGDYRGKIHYYEGNDGLRFIQLSDSDYDEIGSKEENKFLQCDVKYHLSVEQLLNKTKSYAGYQKWDKNNYDLFIHNCQCFVEKAIEALGATRKIKGSRVRSISKIVIPFRILNALEKNENEVASKIEKIPIIGTFFGLARGFACAIEDANK